MAALPTVKDIKVLSTPGNWTTKSGGVLEVITRIDYTVLSQFLTYNDADLYQVPEDIRGLRVYRVTGVSKGSVGANEWHKLRNELFTVLRGSVRWVCTDHLGQTKSFTITPTITIYTPHHILHTYEALEDDTEIAVIANTLFNPDNLATHDTYSVESFHELQTSSS